MQDYCSRVVLYSKIIFLFLVAFLFEKRLNAQEAQVKFEPNLGQFNNQEFVFTNKITSGQIFYTKEKVVFLTYDSFQLDRIKKHATTNAMVNAHAFSCRFVNSNSQKEILGEVQYNEYKNYFKGERKNWVSNVPLFQKLKYKNIYDHIDLQYQEQEGFLKYDFVVHPGGNIADIVLEYEHANIELKNETLLIHTSVGIIKEFIPEIYQFVDGEKVNLSGTYKVEDNKVGFVLNDPYNQNYDVVIDPVVVFSTYSGSSADNWGFTATYDDFGNLYAAGTVRSTGYPITLGAFQEDFHGGDVDIAISKFDPLGTEMLYSTYLGGNSSERPHSLIVDKENNLFVLGTTGSNNFPVTSGSIQETFQGGETITIHEMDFENGSDIFVAKLNDSGDQLLASTYLGGEANDGLNYTTTNAFRLNHNYGDENRGEIYVDGSNNIYVASCTRSADFPVTENAASTTFQGGDQDGCILKLDANLSEIMWSSFIGGISSDAVYSIRKGSNRLVYATGGTTSEGFQTTEGAFDETHNGNVDGFIIALNDAQGALEFSTYTGTKNYDQTYLLDLDEDDNAYVFGQTGGAWDIVNAGYADPGSAQFIEKYSSDLSQLFFSTTFGSGLNNRSNISPTAFMVDKCGKIFLSGWGGEYNDGPFGGNTFGLNTTIDGDQTTDGSDFYFAVFDNDMNNMIYGSFFGADGDHEHVDGGTSRFDKNGYIYQAVCAGCGGSSQFPTTSGVWSETNGSSNCNLAALKIKFDDPPVYAEVDEQSTDTIICNTSFTAYFNESSNNATSHYWDFGYNGASSNISNPSFTYPESGSYEVMYIASNPDACNVNDTDYITIQVVDSFSTNFGIQQEVICENQSVELETGAYGLEITWEMGDGTSYLNQNFVSHVYNNLGEYEVQLIGVNQECSFEDTITQKISILPMLNVQLNTDVIEGCDPLEVNMEATDGMISYTFNFGDGTSPAYSNDVQHTYMDPGTYQAEVMVTDTGFCNSTAFDSVSIIVHEFIEINPQLLYDIDCETQTVNFQNTSDNNNAIYQLSTGDNTTYDNISAINHQYEESGTYNIILIGTDNICNRSDTLQGQLEIKPTHSLNLNANTTSGCYPLEVIFNEQNNWETYVILHFGDGAHELGIVNTEHTYTTPGTYQASIVAIDSNFCNQEDTSYVTINVLDEPPIEPSFDWVPNCEDQSVTLLNTSGNQGANFQWLTGDGGIYNEVTNITHAYSDIGVFEVTLMGYDPVCNRADTFDAIVEVKPVLVSPLISDTSWGCLPMEINFIGEEGYQEYILSFGDQSALLDTNMATHIYAQEGIYTATLITIDSNFCNNTDTSQVQIVVEKGGEINPNFEWLTNCMEQSIELNNLSSPNNVNTIYEWQLGDGTVTNAADDVTYVYDENGDYTITLIGYDTTCLFRDTIEHNIHLDDKFEAILNFEAEDLGCETVTGMFSSVAGMQNYQLDFGDGSSPSTTPFIEHTYEEPGYYTATLIIEDTNYCNHKDTVSTTIFVSDSSSQKAAFSWAVNCANQEVIFTNNSAPFHIGFQYQWYTGDENMYEIPDTTFIHEYDTIGAYNVMLIARDTLCLLEDTLVQEVIMAPFGIETIFEAGPELQGIGPLQVFFQTTPGLGLYEWDFGDGNTETTDTSATNYVYTVPGTYEVKVQLIDSNTQCYDSAYKTVIIDENIEFPNVFSPNNDGLNDVFTFPFSVAEGTYSLIILNRWGQLVFESQSTDLKWDGKTEGGGVAPAGTYFFELKAVTPDNDHSRKGYITLLR